MSGLSNVCRLLGEYEAARRYAEEKLTLEEGGSGWAELMLRLGYSRYVGALQFHHVDPSAKSFSLSERGLARSLERARAEVAKCVLLCANCHAEVEGMIATIPPSGPADNPA